jgi:type VI secretion system protein ImpL
MCSPGQVRTLFASFKPAGVPDVLNGAANCRACRARYRQPARQLSLWPVHGATGAGATGETYAQLQDHMLLPTILKRMETVLAQSVKDGDAKTAYETLRVYKLLHDRTAT